MKSTALFDELYATLTPSQKKAVDTVEGPVLVIAGPGTGKTHILTLRVANILRLTQANPGNILVLTFTDSAARTIRERLRVLVSEAVARDILVTTFHGFAEHLLSVHPEYFPKLQNRRPMSDVEQTLLWREVLQTSSAVLLRPTKTPFFYLKDLSMLAQNLVRERVSLATYRTWAGEEEARIREDESLRYVKGDRKGELKPEGQKKIERLQKVHEAASLIESYEELKEDRGLYDFSDMLDVVVGTMQEDASLRAELQETYQYILADEHQDANALQHALLDALAYDEHPNLFVVGDEKQAIFRFQGADATHFAAFEKQYPRTEVVPLTENFRSYQGILDQAQKLVDAHLEGENVSLSATRKGKASITLLRAPDPLAERDQVGTLIADAIREGTKPEEIAVIASRNLTANLMFEHLRARGIPALRAGDVSINDRPLIGLVLSLMQAVAHPEDMAALRHTLLAPWWGMELRERALLLLQNRDHELPDALLTAYPEVAQTIRALQDAAVSLPPLEAFSRLLTDSGARAFFLGSSEHVSEDVPLLRKLVMHLEGSVARDPNATFTAVVDALVTASEHGLSGVKSSVLQREGEVTVITAHKAKGMEFEKVFIVGLTANEWEKGGKTPGIPSPVDVTRSLGDVLRQFYVALTRAKNDIVLSYAIESSEGRERLPSSFIPEGLPVIAAAENPLPEFHTSIDAPELVRSLTCQYLERDGLSPSALQEYLQSPACFFAKRVLRLREPETYPLAIGNAVHAGIAAYLKHNDRDRAAAALHGSLRSSLLPRNAAFEHLSRDVEARVAAFIDARSQFGEAVAVEAGYHVTRTVSGTDVKLFGKVDALFKNDNGELIVDFKTSTNVKGDKEEFQHQLAFYDLILRANDHNTNEAQIVQVGADSVTCHSVPLSSDTRAAFTTLLDEVLEELVSGSWRAGEPSEYDALLELFN